MEFYQIFPVFFSPAGQRPLQKAEAKILDLLLGILPHFSCLLFPSWTKTFTESRGQNTRFVTWNSTTFFLSSFPQLDKDLYRKPRPKYWICYLEFYHIFPVFFSPAGQRPLQKAEAKILDLLLGILSDFSCLLFPSWTKTFTESRGQNTGFVTWNSIRFFLSSFPQLDKDLYRKPRPKYWICYLEFYQIFPVFFSPAGQRPLQKAAAKILDLLLGILPDFSCLLFPNWTKTFTESRGQNTGFVTWNSTTFFLSSFPQLDKDLYRKLRPKYWICYLEFYQIFPVFFSPAGQRPLQKAEAKILDLLLGILSGFSCLLFPSWTKIFTESRGQNTGFVTWNSIRFFLSSFPQLDKDLYRKPRPKYWICYLEFYQVFPVFFSPAGQRPLQKAEAKILDLLLGILSGFSCLLFPSWTKTFKESRGQNTGFVTWNSIRFFLSSFPQLDIGLSQCSPICMVFYPTLVSSLLFYLTMIIFIKYQPVFLLL